MAGSSFALRLALVSLALAVAVDARISLNAGKKGPQGKRVPRILAAVTKTPPVKPKPPTVPAANQTTPVANNTHTPVNTTQSNTTQSNTTQSKTTQSNTTQSNSSPIYRTLDAYTAAVKAAPGYGQVYAYVWSQTTRQTCSSTSWFKTLFFRLNVPAKIDNVNCVLVSQGIAYTADLADVTGTQNGADIVNLVSVDNVIAWAAQTKICAADLHIMMFAVSTKTGSFDVPDARKSWSCTGARNSIKVPQLCKC